MSGNTIRYSLIILFVLSILSHAKAETLNIGFIKIAPHVIIDKKGEAGGPAIEYFRSIAKQMGINDIKFTELPVPRLLAYLQSGQIDASLILTKTPEREALFVYPQEPLLFIQSAIVVKSSHPLKEIKSANDMLNLKIYTWGKDYRSATMRDSRLNIKPFYDTDTVCNAFKLILDNVIDAFYSPGSNTLQFELKENGYESKLRILPLPDPKVGLFTVFSKESGKKYLEKYETALKQISQEQPYEKLIEQFINNYKKG